MNKEFVADMVQKGNVVGDAADTFLELQVKAYTQAYQDAENAGYSQLFQARADAEVLVKDANDIIVITILFIFWL
jgi:hypothetical protein